MTNRKATTPAARAGAAGALHLEMTVLGGFRARWAGREVVIDSPKARAVLAYLALDGAGAQSRERLAGLLWSESDEERARGSLRQVLRKLREALGALGCDALRADREVLALDRAVVSLDLDQVLGAAERGAAHARALDTPRLPERLLPGFEDLDPAFGDWLRARRQTLQDALLRAYEPLLETGSRDAARALLQLDPTHEAACRCLMRDLAEGGDPGGALRLYEKLWRVLDEDFDIEPSEPTQALVADIKTGRIAPRIAAVPAAPPQPLPAATEPGGAGLRIALVVDPFPANGIAPEQMHLVQVFRHELLARLVRFREWFVLEGPAPAPGDPRVRARYRIGATAYQAGSRISMVLTLSDQDSGIFVWSERLDLSIDTWFDAQHHVLRRIAMALNAQISSDRLARLAAQPGLPPEGYDSWLRCRQMLLGFAAADWDRAFAMSEAMTRSAPNFAPAWCNLAQLDTIAHFTRPGTWRDPAREQRALDHARRAVQLDPTDSRNQLCLGWAHAMVGRFAPADLHMGLALDLNPDDSMPLMAIALYRAFVGDHAAARSLSEQSLRATLMPTRTQWAYAAQIAYLGGDAAAAIDACERAEEVLLKLPAWRAAALHQLGRQAEAERAAARFCEVVAAAWHGTQLPTPASMTRWLLHLYPIRDAQDWQRLRDGVAGAGLPVGGAAHGAWLAPAA